MKKITKYRNQNQRELRSLLSIKDTTTQKNMHDQAAQLDLHGNLVESDFQNVIENLA